MDDRVGRYRDTRPKSFRPTPELCEEVEAITGVTTDRNRKLLTSSDQRLSRNSAASDHFSFDD